VGHVEFHFGRFGDIVSIGARQMHILCRMYHRPKKLFWTHPIEHLGDVESHFGPFGDVLVSVQDRCIVCMNHTIGSEIVLDAPDGTPM
jgi:hypothetical protein